MLRSFSDRVFGGVAGGLASALGGINSWIVRAVWAVLIAVSVGVFAIPYVLLWWLVPQESAVLRRQRRVFVLFPIALLLLTGAAWIARLQGVFINPQTGDDLFWPGALVLLAVAFFLRQFGAGVARRADRQSERQNERAAGITAAVAPDSARRPARRATANSSANVNAGERA